MVDHVKVRRFFADFYTPDNLVIAAVGNIEHETLVALCREYLGELQGKEKKFDKTAPLLTPYVTLRAKDI